MEQALLISLGSVTTWALQVQFLLQIIINRVSILLTNRQKAYRLKIGVAILITAVNISVYCIWVPARLQISDRFEHINNIWDRCEKGIYLLVDAALNWYFIKTVRTELVNRGCKFFNHSCITTSHLPVIFLVHTDLAFSLPHISSYNFQKLTAITSNQIRPSRPLQFVDYWLFTQHGRPHNRHDEFEELLCVTNHPVLSSILQH